MNEEKRGTRNHDYSHQRMHPTLAFVHTLRDQRSCLLDVNQGTNRLGRILAAACKQKKQPCITALSFRHLLYQPIKLVHARTFIV